MTMKSTPQRRVIVMNMGDDPELNSCDVVVELPTGERFGATFFTQKYLGMLMEKNKRTGEFAGGKYLWAANMIIVSILDTDVIEATVDDLLLDGQLRLAFMKFEPPN
jgi:hypothetical protein